MKSLLPIGVFGLQVKVLMNRCRVDESADSARFLLARLDFTHAKCQVNQNLSTESPERAVGRSLVTNHVFLVWREKRDCVLFFFPGYVTLFRMDQQNLYFPITAAIVWAIYQAKIKNGTFENA